MPPPTLSAANPVLRSIIISAWVLGGFALIGTGLVAFTHQQTAERIVANEKAQRLKALSELVDPSRYDNALDSDTITVTDSALLGTQAPVTVYRARKNGLPVAVLITPVAPDGYSGAIKLLVGINHDGRIAGVRVTAHRETPGLGDAIEISRSTWITTFAGKSLDNPAAPAWRVKKDGGEFDQFTGATITPRAVVTAVHKALQYYQRHRQALFAGQADKAGEQHSE